MKKRILIISNDKSLKPTLKSSIIDYLLLICPTKSCLEEIILNNHFECIIPLDAVIQDKSGAKYNILRLLDNYRFEHFGNSYIKYITVNEKAAFLLQTGYQLECQYYSINQFASLQKTISDKDIPVLIDTENNERYLITSIKDTPELFSKLAKNNVQSVCLYKRFQFDTIYDSIMIGNMQNNLFAISGKKDEYWNIISKISTEVFSKFNFKDFLHLSFGRKGEKLFIIGINVGNPFSESILGILNEKYSLSLEQVIDLYSYLSCVKCDCSIEIIKSFLNKIPPQIISNLVTLDIKQRCNINYSYQDVCSQLKSRLLNDDDSNRYEYSKMIMNGLAVTPESRKSSYCLGNKDFRYDEYLSSYEKIPIHPKDPNQTLYNSLKVLNGQTRWNSYLSFYNICPPTMMNAVSAATITKIYNPNGMIDRTCAGYLCMEKQLVRQLSNLLEIDPSASSGIFTSGGKVCLTYGVKCGLNRCEREYNSTKSPVIITSNANHFSIEDVGFQLGIKTCKRIPLTASQEIDYEKLDLCISNCMQNEIPIACIIVSGGNTMHSVVEDISRVKEIVKSNVNKFHVTYIPYIYFDMVVGWPWLFYKIYDFDNNPLSIDDTIIKKISFITERLRNSNLADGFGFDFHKGGFSPYSTSLFVTKNKSDLYSINSLNGEIREESCYHSFNNSRSTTGIIAAWNIIQSVATEGFQSYIANALKVSDVLSKTFTDAGLTVLGKDNTYGFATLIWIKSPKLLNATLSDVLESESMKTENDKYIYQFTEYLKRNNNIQICTRYLPKYNYKNYSLTVISFLSMTLNLNQENALEIAYYIINAKSDFDAEYPTGKFSSFEDAPKNVPR